MTINNLWDELAIWLVPVTIAAAIIHYYAVYLVVLFIVYFITVRLLERITLPALHEKPVVITGCDSGFGFDLALKCIRNGMPTFAACYSEQGIKAITQAASKLPNGNSLIHAFQMDVANDESVKKGVEFVTSHIDQKKGIWAVVNNAGIGDLRGWDDWEPPHLYQRCWDVNTLGVIRVTQAFKNLVKKQKGRIVNVSSIMAKFPMPGFGPYSVSKYAVAAYNDIIRMELAIHGVTVCCLEPGFFRSPQANPSVARDDLKKVWDKVSDDVKEEYGEEYFKWTQDIIAGYLEYKCQEGSYRVIDAYYNAITSKYPRRRYQVGYDSTFQFTPLSYLPTRWQDWMMRFYFTYVDRPPRLNKPHVAQ